MGFLHQRGIGLCAGRVIITGSLNGLWRLPVNQPVSIEFGELARVQVEFATELCLAWGHLLADFPYQTKAGEIVRLAVVGAGVAGGALIHSRLPRPA